MATSEKKSFTGSCHCGTIRMKINIATPFNVQRCNCTICAKPGFSSLNLDESDFTLISPASKSELSKYIANKSFPQGNQRYFCPNCGASLCMEGSYEWEGKMVNHFAVNATLLDQPQDGLDLSEVKLKYCDGLHNNQYAGLKDVPWSGGMV